MTDAQIDLQVVSTINIPRVLWHNIRPYKERAISIAGATAIFGINNDGTAYLGKYIFNNLISKKMVPAYNYDLDIASRFLVPLLLKRMNKAFNDAISKDSETTVLRDMIQPLGNDDCAFKYKIRLT